MRRIKLRGIVTLTAVAITLSSCYNISKKAFNNKVEKIKNIIAPTSVTETTPTTKQNSSFDNEVNNLQYGSYLGETTDQNENQEYGYQEENLEQYNTEQDSYLKHIQNTEEEIKESFFTNDNFSLDDIEQAVTLSDAIHSKKANLNQKATLQNIIETPLNPLYIDYENQPIEEFIQMHSNKAGIIDSYVLYHTKTIQSIILGEITDIITQYIIDEGYTITGKSLSYIKDNQIIILIPTIEGTLKINSEGTLIDNAITNCNACNQINISFKNNTSNQCPIIFEGLDETGNYSLYTVYENKEIKQILKEAISLSQNIQTETPEIQVSSFNKSSLSLDEQELYEKYHTLEQVYETTINITLQQNNKLQKSK